MRWRDLVVLAAAFAAPLVATAVVVPFRDSFPNTDAALVLVAIVVAVAATTGKRSAGYLAAVSSAVWFDFFLTRPYEQFSITRSSDVETTVLLLIVGAAVTELAVWGRRQQALASQRAAYLRGIYAAAEATTPHGGPDSAIAQVADQLTRLLDLVSCRWQPGVAGLGGVARLHHDGHVTVDRQAWDVDSHGLPPRELELLVRTGGRFFGRFVMLPAEGSHPSQEHRLVAVAVADQVGAQLAGRELSRQ
jgi:K+-sensing histidine kinase KdpD